MDERLNLTVDQGAAFDRTFVWYRHTGTPVNLTGWTALFEVVAPDGGAPIVSLTQGAGVTLGGAAGTIKVHLDAAATAALEPTGPYPLSYTLTVTGGSPSRAMRIASGAFNVDAEDSRANGTRVLVDDRERGRVEVHDELELFVDAAEVAFTPAGTIAAGNVQAALEEVAAEAAAGGGAAALAVHEADTTAVHGIANTALLETQAGAQTKADAAAAAAASALSTHAGAADPHTGYQKESEKGQASGYASLDGSGVVPDAQIPAAIARDSEVTSAVAAEATARTSAITAAVAGILNSAPGALDTLNELAAALGNDANFAATVTAALAGKQPLDSDLTALAALTTTSFGRALLELANQAALLAAAGAAAAVHTHAGDDITSGTVADARIAATIARDSEVTSAVAALSSVYQPLDSDLSALAALTQTAWGQALLTLADPGAGKVIQSVSGVPAGVYPPGYEIDYKEITTNAPSTATTEAGATAIITGNARTYDGSTVVMIEARASSLDNSADANATIVNLWEDSTDLGRISNRGQIVNPGWAKKRRTPSAGSHTYTVKMWVSAGTGTLYATSPYVPAYLRVVKV